MSSQCLSWVINGPDGPEIRLPLFPRKRTQVGHRAMSGSCQYRKSKSFDRPMRQPSDWVVWCYNFDAIAAFPGPEGTQMAKRGQAVRRSPTRSKVPTKPKGAPTDVDLKKENATLRRELAEALERQTATSEVLQVISASPGDLEPVFQKMLENATRVCGAKFGTMTLVEGSFIRRVAAYNVPFTYADAPETRTFQPHPESGLGQVMRTKQVARILDLRTSPPYLERNPAVVSLVEDAGARTIIVVPMLKATELVGTISVYRQEVRPFTEK